MTDIAARYTISAKSSINEANYSVVSAAYICGAIMRNVILFDSGDSVIWRSNACAVVRLAGNQPVMAKSHFIPRQIAQILADRPPPSVILAIGTRCMIRDQETSSLPSSVHTFTTTNSSHPIRRNAAGYGTTKAGEGGRNY